LTPANLPFVSVKIAAVVEGRKLYQYKIDGDEAQLRTQILNELMVSVPQIFIKCDQHVGGCDDVYSFQGFKRSA